MAWPIPRAISVPWFTRETYEVVQKMSDGEMFDTFDTWRKAADRKYNQLLEVGLSVEKTMVDPDDLLAFARSQGNGKVDAATRSDFAAMFTARSRGGDRAEAPAGSKLSERTK